MIMSDEMTNTNKKAAEIKHCLTCKYEPKWGDWCGGEYPRQSGACRWDGYSPEYLPSTYRVTVSHVTRYKDDSGCMRGCPCWAEKLTEVES